MLAPADQKTHEAAFFAAVSKQHTQDCLLNSQMTCLRELDLSENGISEAEAWKYSNFKFTAFQSCQKLSAKSCVWLTG